MGFVFTSLQILEDLKMTEILGLYIVVLVFFPILLYFVAIFHNYNLKSLEGIKKTLAEVKKQNSVISVIIESQRLLMVLKFEKDPKVDQVYFEANKEALMGRVSKTLAGNPTHPNPETLAYTILEQIGIPLFVSGATRLEIQKSLGILIANDASKGVWSDFLKEVIDQL